MPASPPSTLVSSTRSLKKQQQRAASAGSAIPACPFQHTEARAASAATDKPRHLPEPADWHAGGVRHKDETMAMGTIREERSSDTARPGGEHTPRAHACAVVGERREGRRGVA